MDGRRGSPARLLAPLALVVFAIAFFLVVVGSDAPDDSGENRRPQAQRVQSGSETTTTTEPRVGGRFYTVQTGDTLAGIAEKVGVPIERLQELNPDLDPQALVSGQKIRLRE